MTDKKAIETAKALVEHCANSTCQNCVFREYHGDRWGCCIKAPATYDFMQIESNAKGRKGRHIG